jgi:hypothetical protein
LPFLQGEDLQKDGGLNMNWDDYRWYKCNGSNTSWNQDLIIKVDTENLLNNKMKKKEGYKDLFKGYYSYLGVGLTVKKIIHSGRCTIVIWEDGSKTIVKQSEDDDWDEYAAFCAAFCKKVFGSTSAVKRMIDKKTVAYRPTNKEKKEETK